MELDKKDLGGTHYKESALKEGKLLSLAMEPKLQYAWDNGPAIGRYLAELKEGRLIARKCNKCRRIMIPPRMFCELCWRPTDHAWGLLNKSGSSLTLLSSWEAFVRTTARVRLSEYGYPASAGHARVQRLTGISSRRRPKSSPMRGRSATQSSENPRDSLPQPFPGRVARSGLEGPGNQGRPG